MGELPRPDLPPGARRDLSEALHDLHHRAGWPSLRTLAREVGCSHTTVSKAFSVAALPTWGVLELLVVAMQGDVERFRGLWLGASLPDAERSSTAQVDPMRIAGRAAELTAVGRHLVSGTGLLVISGEAGMGKTKLVTTAAAMAGRDTFVATGSCLPLSSEVPLLPIADALRRIHAIDDGQWIKEALAGCAPYVRGALRVLLPELDEIGLPPEPDNDWSRQRLFVAVESALGSLADLRPLAVLIEDLHWADAMTLDLLEHALLSRAAAVPIVGTWREEDPSTKERSVEWLARVGRLGVVHLTNLSTLTRDETAVQLGMLTSTPPDQAWVDQIYRRTQGQPLFTEQLAAEAITGESTPRLLVDLLDRRLDGLSDAAWPAARAMGVADRALSGDQLQKVTALSGAQLDDCLRELRKHRLLAATTSPHDVRLRHPLLAEAIRRRLVAGEARAEHRRLATVLAGAGDISAGEVATHWRAADDADREREWRIRAAREASLRFAADQAAQEWLRVIELWPPHADSAEEGLTLSAAYVAALDELVRSDDRERGRALGTEAVSRLQSLDSVEAAELYRRLAVCLGPVDLSAALAMVTEAVEIYETVPPSHGLLVALEVQSHYLRASGRLSEAGRAIARAVQASDTLADPSWQRRTQIQVAWYDLVAGDPSRAMARVRDAIQITPSSTDPVAEMIIAIEHTDVLLLTCAPAEAVEQAARPGLEFADWGIGTHLISVLRGNVAQALTEQGHLERSAALLDPVTSGEVTRGAWTDHLERAHLDIARGQLASARSRLAALADAMQRFDDDDCLRWVAHRAALADLWEGRPQAALDGVVTELVRAEATDLTFWGSLYVLAARAAADTAQQPLAAARRTELRRQLDELRAAATTDPLGPGSPCGDRLAARYTWDAEQARLDGAQTVERWVLGAAEWDKISRPYDAAYCRWRAAEVAIADGQATLAKRLLGRAERQARLHVPLSRAIRATSQQGPPRAPAS